MTYRFSRPNNYKFINTICKDLKQAKAFVRYFYRAHKIKLHVTLTKDLVNANEMNTMTKDVHHTLKEILNETK